MNFRTRDCSFYAKVSSKYRDQSYKQNINLIIFKDGSKLQEELNADLGYDLVAVAVGVNLINGGIEFLRQATLRSPSYFTT